MVNTICVYLHCAWQQVENKAQVAAGSILFFHVLHIDWQVRKSLDHTPWQPNHTARTKQQAKQNMTQLHFYSCCVAGPSVAHPPHKDESKIMWW
jgi:hypothetical protein